MDFTLTPHQGTPRVLQTEWVDLRRDEDSGIESISAHFSGHAYDPHAHDEMLVGVTLQGVQRFRCGRTSHVSTPGKSILIEPGAIHDGHAPHESGFTYAMLYLPQPWLSAMAGQLQLPAVSRFASFDQTLHDDVLLAQAIHRAFLALHQREGRLARDEALDRMLVLLARRIRAPASEGSAAASPALQRVRELMHAQLAEDLSLDDLVACSGLDRFRLTRQFSAAFGSSPHAYLVQLRLRVARRLLAGGAEPAQVAADTGFADQSHLGRWFRRAYRITPAAYRLACTNVLAGS
ncbi:MULTISPECIES: AraC family transcriptional regulator [unclassified Herbaspirillum]|uniref:AraC family transcriptional regulator n=1 Tax=unclassified Herbaspirillum TaxID=2624150 RepID=UPI000C0AD274|nr:MULTISPECIES: AraC family transcriptional regulator [unclassified Herbaspirillum]MAF04045.1 AraC family transcriptional regulator [Herbaspirillum sp.]MBO16826.1 AraC family transcriptional regulator [Herbaspirillum sp.]|tara:strand:+ start:17278 stop:18153 length:876 start_codon:yes stop_codon:yes gene_type:complete